MEKHFPVIGQGVFIFNIKRASEFRITIAPQLDAGNGGNEKISLIISKDKATFQISGTHNEVLVDLRGIDVGYDPTKRIAYWFSNDRDLNVLKYGKG
jgi:hypothetical protein